MKKGFSLASLLGKGRGRTRLPDLGTRELAVLDVLWRHNAITSQDVLSELGDESLSLSTVQSTLERLHRKEIVSRAKQGRAYRYRARLSRENIISRLMHDIADNLADGDAAPMVSGFLDYLGDEGRVRDTRVRRSRRIDKDED